MTGSAVGVSNCKDNRGEDTSSMPDDAGETATTMPVLTSMCTRRDNDGASNTDLVVGMTTRSRNLGGRVRKQLVEAAILVFGAEKEPNMGLGQ